MKKTFLLLAALLVFNSSAIFARDFSPEENPLRLPSIGDFGLKILSPDLLELTLITTKESDPAHLKTWDFVSGTKFIAPAVSDFLVTAGTNKIAVQSVGFKRRPIYAPLKQRDLRIGNHLYLRLASALPENEIVEVKNPTGRLWSADKKFKTKNDPLRWSPVIHVNQTGYLPEFRKLAMVGFYLGSFGEMKIPAENFKVLDANSGVVFEGKLEPRRDVGYEPPDYQEVLEADFSGLKSPGEYRLQIPGIGTSFPFLIDDGIAANFARTYALGLYHQRCGGANELPFTRFLHGKCHIAPAEIPTTNFATVNEFLAEMSENFKGNPRHTAPQLKSVSASLYPFVNKGKIDVSGGHHDAGDYSKYTINSAQLIHALVFAADNFPGVGALDNLGLPESGDGKSDILQEAKWEADFLAKMQDADGGFYFLVYPKERAYEHDVLPDKGDPQVVFPKTTAATAAAVAALAQTGSSPLFKKQFPADAEKYLACAKKGWAFLEKATAKFGRDGSYQKITHYGDEFMHEDELAWAATEMFLATGDRKIEENLLAHFNPDDRETRRWTWWRLFESYGCAIRSYAFAANSGRIAREKLDKNFLVQCEKEIIEAARDQLRYSNENAYGTSFAGESKRFRNAGWYFSSDRAFDLATACALDFPEKNDPRPRFLEAIIENFSYELGCNPVNVSYVSGLGWKRPREMVHHVAQNDREILPPSGLPWGNIQEGFPFLDPYQKELGALCFPADWDKQKAFPFYDRWGDTFNTSQEFVVPNLARSLATAAFLMAKSGLKNQSWRAAEAQILLPEKIKAGEKISAELKTSLPLKNARIVWEFSGKEPRFSENPAQLFVDKSGPNWIEAEACLPDGRRVFARKDFDAK